MTDQKGLKRTFPKKPPPGKGGPPVAKKGKKEEKPEGKKDGFMSEALRRGGWEESEEIKRSVYQKCFFVLRCISKIQNNELRVKTEKKGPLFFARVNLNRLKVERHAANAESEFESMCLSAYGYFKYLIATASLLPEGQLFVGLLIRSFDPELVRLSAIMATLMQAFTAAYGHVVGSSKRAKVFGKASSAFQMARGNAVGEMVRLAEEVRGTKLVRKDATSREEIEEQVERMEEELKKWKEGEKKEEEKKERKKITFESDEEEKEERGSQVSSCAAVANGDEIAPPVLKKIKLEVKKEESESELEIIEEKKVRKKRKEEKKKEEEKERKKVKKEEMETDEEEDEQMPSTSHSASAEFRSNLVELASTSWQKSVEKYSIEDVPKKKARFKMSAAILSILEEKYGEEMDKALQFYTLQTFTASDLKRGEEVIGLLLYLDGEEQNFVDTSFFFRLLVANDMETTTRALDKIDKLCRAQFEYIGIRRSQSLGKDVKEERKEVEERISALRRKLYRAYPDWFPFMEGKIRVKKEEKEEMVLGKKIKKEKEEEKKEKEEEKKEKKKVKMEVDSDSDFCEIIEIPMKKVKVEEISDGEEKKEGERKRKSSSKKSWAEDTESTSTPQWMKIEKADSQMDTNEATEEKELSTFRNILAQLSSEYWTDMLAKNGIWTTASLDDMYKLARKIIRFYEAELGDDFHEMMKAQTRVKFSPSDLQEKEEVVGLAMWLNRIKFPCTHLVILLLAMNDELLCDSLLPQTVESGRARVELLALQRRYDAGENIGAHLKETRTYLNNVTITMLAEIPKIFDPILLSDSNLRPKKEKLNRMDQDVDIESTEVIEDMKNELYNDPHWTKTAKKFQIQSDWTLYDVCENAIMVFEALSQIFKGNLPNRCTAIFDSKRSHELQLRNIASRKSLVAVKVLMCDRYFPAGFSYLLLRNKSKKVLDIVCGKLSCLKFDYIRMFEMGEEKKEELRTKYDLMKNHPIVKECISLLKDHLKSDEFGVTPLALKILPPLISKAKSAEDKQESKKNRKKEMKKLKETWELKEWETNHEVEMEDLSQRINQFHLRCVIRPDHFKKKMDLRDKLQLILDERMKGQGYKLDIVGSSPSSLSAYNSNLDLHASSAQLSLNRLKNAFRNLSDVTVADDLQRGITLVVNDATEGQKVAEVRIHLQKWTPFMCTLYQVVDHQDERVGKLTLALKAWKLLDHDAKITSYHLTILVIHFLQCGVSPPILTKLDHIKEGEMKDAISHDKLERKGDIPNKQSLASLVLGFFHYYSSLEYEKYIISIMGGALLPRNPSDICSIVFIENPYPGGKNTSYTTSLDAHKLRAVCLKAKKTIQKQFKVPYVDNL